MKISSFLLFWTYLTNSIKAPITSTRVRPKLKQRGVVHWYLFDPRYHKSQRILTQRIRKTIRDLRFEIRSHMELGAAQKDHLSLSLSTPKSKLEFRFQLSSLFVKFQAKLQDASSKFDHNLFQFFYFVFIQLSLLSFNFIQLRSLHQFPLKVFFFFLNH